jgi:4-hydroxybenzoate polyprenyltransferase
MLQRLKLYGELMRLHKPIGIFLLLWPTLWGLWWAAGGMPPLNTLVVFVLGTVLMRSAGCAVNDYADRDFDRYVRRTAQRPVTSGRLSGREALCVAAGLALMAGGLVWFYLPPLVFYLSFPALILAASYPFFKRFFALPQAYLGICFGFGIPMAYAAITQSVPFLAWALMLVNVLWTVAYDTQYAMVDKEDDLKIGIRTSAITFGNYDVLAIMLCYVGALLVLAILAIVYQLKWGFWLGWGLAAAIGVYNFQLIKKRNPEQCFKAFLHNNWWGAAVFLAVLLG